MTGDERPEAEPGYRGKAGVGLCCGIDRDEAAQETAASGKERPRLVPLREREHDAARAAEALVEALSQYLLVAEERVLNKASRIRASMLDDVERQRANVESLIGLFAERLRLQQEGLVSLEAELRRGLDRLDEQVDAIRSLREAEMHHNELLGHLQDTLRLLAGAVEDPAAWPRSPE